jgi:hypothetical protein
MQNRTPCSRLSTVWFATGLKRSMGHVLGAKNSFAVQRRTRPQGGRAGGILSIPAQQVSLGSPRAGTIHVQAPTSHTPPLQSFLWSISLNKSAPWTMNSLALASRALREHYAAASMTYAVQATTHYQTYPERPPGADLPPKKVCNLDPVAPRPRKKRQFL